MAAGAVADLVVAPGQPVSLHCEAAGPPEAGCRWVSPSGCCYGEGCAQNSQDCRSPGGWRLEREEDTGAAAGAGGVCVLSLAEVEREEDGDWECEQGHGRVRLSLTVLSRGRLDWLGENLTGLERRNINTVDSRERMSSLQRLRGAAWSAWWQGRTTA